MFADPCHHSNSNSFMLPLILALQQKSLICGFPISAERTKRQTQLVCRLFSEGYAPIYLKRQVLIGKTCSFGDIIPADACLMLL